MTPTKFLQSTVAYALALKYAKGNEVAVGLPKGSAATKKIYSDDDKGPDVLRIGVIHEYGRGKNPMRSFIRMPVNKYRKQIQNALAVSFNKIVDKGADPQTQLERVGAYVQNIILKAFNTGGYGTWKKISQSQARKKGTNKILVQSGTLKRAITYLVRKRVSS